MPFKRPVRRFRRRFTPRPQTICFKVTRVLTAGQNIFTVAQVTGGLNDLLVSRPNRLQRATIRAAAAVPCSITADAYSNLGTGTTPEIIGSTSDRVAGTAEMAFPLRLSRSQNYGRYTAATDSVMNILVGGPCVCTITLVFNLRMPTGLNAN